MKKNNKVLIASITLIIALFCCGCNQPKNASSIISIVSENETLNESDTPSEPVQSTISSDAISASEVSSVPDPTPSIESTTDAKPYTPVLRDPIKIGEYTVIDPENARGISNERNGWSFGVASNGIPASPSVNSQNKFDSMDNINALAVDLISNDNRMYLTFDCGYEYNNLTASILDTLKEKNVKAAFFCTLSYIKDNPLLVSRMIDEGHIVGNHSATHANFTKINRIEMANELYQVDKYLGENFGYKSVYFRFPEGCYSHNALELVTSVGFKSVFWSLAYADWDTRNQPTPENAFATITSRYHKGAVILLHAVSQTNTDILGSLIDDAHAKGYTFKSLDEYYN